VGKLRERRTAGLLEERTLPHDATAEYILSRCRDVENCPEETLAPYQEFVEERKVYYFTPGGSSTAGTPGPRRWEASSAAT